MAMPVLPRMWRAWQLLARDIGDLQARLLLTTFYFLIAAGFGLIMKLVRDPLNLRRRSQRSRWSLRGPGATDLQAGRHQF